MRTARHVAVAALSTALAVGGSALSWTPAHGEPVTCQGLPVTVEGIVGTEGDDVMLAPLNAWKEVQGLGGNDTICLVDGPERGSRDPRFFADAGPGDDSVFFEATYYASVVLGAGADRFIGNDVGTSVYTGAYDSTLQTNDYFGQADTETDVVVAGGGRDTVYSGDTAGFAANPDRISTGGSNVDTDTVFWAGRMTIDGELDNGASRDLVFLVDTWGPGELVIDNSAGRAELAGMDVLRWTGVRDFVVAERPASLRFVGGPAPEDLTVGDYELPTPGAPMTVDVVTRGGRDRVSLAGALEGRIGLGGGRDDLTLGGACDSTRVVLGSRLLCRQGSALARTTLAGVDGLLVRGRDVVAIGTGRADRIWVYGRSSRVLGRGGADRLEAPGRGGVVDGGPGRDRCSGRTTRNCEL